MNDFPTLPVVIRQSKRLGFILVVATGLPLWLALPHQPASATAPPTGMASLLRLLPFLLAFLLGVLMLLRPARLILTPEGLTYERLLRFWRRSWRWPEVSDFRWEVVGTGKGKRAAIVFTSGANQVEVASDWEWSAQEVLDLLNHARTTWGGQAAAPALALDGTGGGKQPRALPQPQLLEAAKPATIPLSTAASFGFWAGAGLLIGVGSLVGYWWGYKDSLLLAGVYITLVIFGWLGLLFAAIALLGATTCGNYQPRPVSLLGRLKHRLVQVGYVVAGLVWLGLLVGNLLVVDQYGTQRVERLLAAGPTATTLATVTQLRERNSRSGTSRATVLTYQAGTEQVSQALPGIGQYAVGQQLRVKYVVAHPDMFAVVP